MVEFLARNYIWFLVIAVVLVFALIGFLIEQKNNEGTKEKKKKEQDDVVNLETIGAAGMTLGAALENKDVVLENVQDDSIKPIEIKNIKFH